MADKQAVHDDMERARATFHQLLDRASEADLRRRSEGTRWTNRQLLFHMLLGYLVYRFPTQHFDFHRRQLTLDAER